MDILSKLKKQNEIKIKEMPGGYVTILYECKLKSLCGHSFLFHEHY